MSGSIVKRQKGNKIYYYYHSSYRVKLDLSNKGKRKGSGKSKVITTTKYLGTAEDIYKGLTQGQEKANKILTYLYGLPMALYFAAKKIKLIETINEVIPERINGISIGEYLLIAAINRVGKHHSKAKIGNWFKKTTLPEKMKIDPSKLTSEAYWKAYDAVIPQKKVYEKMEEYKDRRKNRMTYEETQSYLTENIIWRLEEGIYKNLFKAYHFTTDTLLYDTTNFYNYISGSNERCILPQTGKSKDGKHSNRQVGLLVAVESEFGFPLSHCIYQANAHDSSIFPEALTRISQRLSEFNQGVNDYIVVFDKGNNSQKNMEKVRKISGIKGIVGSLGFNSFKHLRRIPLKNYKGGYQKWKFVELEDEAFGEKAKVVMTYSEKEKIHELKNFNKKIVETQQKMEELVKKSKTKNITNLKNTIDKKLNQWKIKSSLASKYITYELIQEQEEIIVKIRKTTNAKNKQLEFGKRILFTYNHDLSAETIMRLYHDKHKVEDVFRNFKKGAIVDYSPLYHWTDSKIRVQCFVNVLAYLLIKLVEKEVSMSGDRLTLSTLTKLLEEIHEIVMVYSIHKVVKEISYPAELHKEIGKIFHFDQFDGL